MSAAIWWIRRDLRLHDNEALTAVLAQNNPVIPLFILDPTLLNASSVGEKRLAFLFGALNTLDKALQQRGSRLIIRHGVPIRVLPAFMAETGATQIIAEADYSNYARARDERVAQLVPLQLVGGTAVRAPNSVLKKDGTPYTVYTPFSKVWKGLPLPRRQAIVPTPERIITPADIPSEPLPIMPILPESVPFPPSEVEGQQRLHRFVKQKVYAYDDSRDRMDLAGTSQLSPYLRFGLLSPRLAAVTAVEAIGKAPDEKGRDNARVWLNELIWRDFYIHILYHFPHVSQRSFKPQWRDIPWRNNKIEFDAWCQGQTGYPVVDAAMRQLLHSGWMHNRARMIVASFLVKDLLIDWRWGERWFMQHLVDGDPAANNGGWQWSAGTGTDAAPYFRIFNPISQSKKFDPNGRYIRRWVPELKGVTDDKYIHEPWRMPPLFQHKANCLIGRDYPAPIVDHKMARQRVLDTYKAAKVSS